MGQSERDASEGPVFRPQFGHFVIGQALYSALLFSTVEKAESLKGRKKY